MEEIVAVYKKVLSKEYYFNIKGRTSRREFWTFFISNFVLMMLFGFLGKGSLVLAGISVLFYLFILIPEFTMSVRRLHDVDMSGWFLLIGLIPILGGIALMIFNCTKGTMGPNRFGPNPEANNDQQP